MAVALNPRQVCLGTSRNWRCRIPMASTGWRSVILLKTLKCKGQLLRQLPGQDLEMHQWTELLFTSNIFYVQSVGFSTYKVMSFENYSFFCPCQESVFNFHADYTDSNFQNCVDRDSIFVLLQTLVRISLSFKQLMWFLILISNIFPLFSQTRAWNSTNQNSGFMKYFLLVHETLFYLFC